MELPLGVFLCILYGIHLRSVCDAQTNEALSNCRRCDVSEEDYQRGWVQACKTVKTITKPQRRCYAYYFSHYMNRWLYHCIYVTVTEQEIEHSCCPHFALHNEWCRVPPRPQPQPLPITQPPPLIHRRSNCGRSKYANSGRRLTYVIGGETAYPHEFPWQASIRIGTNGPEGHLCGGAIISPYIILTAAHCAFYYRAYPNLYKYVVVGDFNRQETERSQSTYDIVDVIFHPSYSRREVLNDIALLRVESAIVFSQDVQPVCMPSNINENFANMDVIVSGWGSKQRGGVGAQLLQFTHLKVISNHECNLRIWRYGVSVTDQMLCTTDGGTLTQRDACNGDSGGPLVYQEADGRYTVIGLVSWGLGCAVGTPGVYTRVTQFIDWINTHQ